MVAGQIINFLKGIYIVYKLQKDKIIEHFVKKVRNILTLEFVQ